MRYWSILFALAAIFSVGIFAYAPLSPDWWLPNPPGEPYHVASTFGRDIDSLFLIVLWITGIVFIGTQIALVYVAWKLRRRAGPRRDLLPRQPAAGGRLDDHPGRDPRLHRPLSDGNVGAIKFRRLDAAGCNRSAEVTARAISVGVPLPRPRRQAALPPTTCTPSTTCTSSRASRR